MDPLKMYVLLKWGYFIALLVCQRFFFLTGLYGLWPHQQVVHPKRQSRRKPCRTRGTNRRPLKESCDLGRDQTFSEF